MLTQSIKKNFLIDPLNINNAIYRDSLSLKTENRSLLMFSNNKANIQNIFKKSSEEVNIQTGKHICRRAKHEPT